MLTDKGTTPPFIVSHFETNQGENRCLALIRLSVLFDEFSGGQPKLFFHPQDIVRGQDQIEVSAASSKTGDARVAEKRELVFSEGPDPVLPSLHRSPPLVFWSSPGRALHALSLAERSGLPCLHDAGEFVVCQL
jgi:hypothetical protein